MSDISSVASAPRPEDLKFVLAGSGPNDEYQVGTLLVGEEPARRSISVIFVTSLEDRVIVAFPQNAWDRKVAKRKLPAGPFTKPLLVEIYAAAPEDREQQADYTLRIWIGALSKVVADTVVFSSDPIDADVSFASPGGFLALPYAPALIQLADSHFSFVTAPSGDVFEIRLKGLEASVGEIASALKTLTQAQVGAGAFASAPVAAARPKAKAREGSIPGTPPPRGGQASELPTLDPALAKLARFRHSSRRPFRDPGPHLKASWGTWRFHLQAPACCSLHCRSRGL